MLASLEQADGRTAIIVRSLREAGSHGLADAVEAQTTALASAWPATFGGPLIGEQADRNRRGRVAAEVSDLVRQADHVAGILPDLVLQAIEERAWLPRSSASGKPLPGLTPTEWIVSPEGLHSSAARIVTMLEFALHAQDDPRPEDLAADKVSGRGPDVRREHARRALEAFEALAGVATGDAEA